MAFDNLLVFCLLCACSLSFLSSEVHALYASQLGVYDWLRKGVGYVKESVLSKSGAFIVSTEDGVLASLNIRDGSLAWRNALPEGGDIEQFAVSNRAEADVVYALISMPCKAGDVECRNIVVQGWGVQEGTMLFETYLGQSFKGRSGESVFDIAYYSSLEGSSSLMALGLNTLYDINIVSGAIESKWSPSDKSARLAALANRKMQDRDIVAVGCYASGSACGRALIVRAKGSLDKAELVYTGSISGQVGGIRPAVGFKEGADWVYSLKGASLQLLSLESGRASTITLPPLIGGGEVSYMAGYVQAPSEADSSEDKNTATIDTGCGAIIVLRCSSRACQSNKYYLPCPSASSASVVLSPAVLACEGSGARVGVGRSLGSPSEAVHDATLSCASRTNPHSDQEGGGTDGYGVGVSILDGPDGLVTAGKAHMVVPSTRRHGFSSILHTACHIVSSPSGDYSKGDKSWGGGSGNRLSNEGVVLPTMLCVAMTSAGTLMGLRQKRGEWTHLWTREEALSRSIKAALYDPPAAVREAIQKYTGEDSSVSVASIQSLVKAILSSFAKTSAYFLHRVTSLPSSLASSAMSSLSLSLDPFKVASSAGASFSAKESSRHLAAMQARMYGLDKVGIFLTRSKASSSLHTHTLTETVVPPLLVAVDMATEEVLWINELVMGDRADDARMLRTDIDTVSVVVSSPSGADAGTTIVDVDILSGEWAAGGAMTFSGLGLQGVFPLSTSLAQSLRGLGVDADKGTKASSPGGGGGGGRGGGQHALLLEKGQGSGHLLVTIYPPSTSASTSTEGLYLSRVKEGLFSTLRVLPDTSTLPTKCADVGTSSSSSSSGAGECKAGSVVVQEVEVVASSVFSSSAGAEGGVAMDSIAAVAYQHPDDVVNNRVTTLGDDSLLMKYLNPATALIVTEHKVPISNSTMGSQLEVHFFDTVSAKLLYRSSIPNGASPVQAVVVENQLMVSYWNHIMKRTEMSSVSLFEGMIDKQGLTPWASKASAAIASKHKEANTFSSFSAPLPMAIQKTFIVPKTVTAAGTTITRQGVAKKALIVGTSGGQLFSIDRQIINPRRPLENPTNAEKADGLYRYEPYLQLDNLGSPTHNYSMGFAPFSIISAPSKLESSTVILSLSRLDVHFNRVIPSLAFDLLSPDFNYPLLCLIVAGLVILVLWMQKTVAARKKAKAWA